MSTNTRDLLQRSIGCISISAIAHSGLIAALLLTPKASSPDHKADLGGSAGGSPKSSPVEVVESSPVASVSAPAPQKETALPVITEPAKPAARQETKPVIATTKLTPKQPTTLPPVKALKTVKASPVEVQAKPSTPELEELSPVIADESGSSETAGAQDADTPTPTPVVTSSEAPMPTAMTNELPARPEEVKPVNPTVQNLESTKESASEVSGSDGGNQSAPAPGTTGVGTGAGTNAGKGEGDSSSLEKVVEASLREPLSGNPLPRYPAKDRLRRHQGTVVVLGDVRRDGTLENVRVDKSSGSNEMDVAALTAFKKWKFAPGPEATVRKAFQFNLQGEAQVGYASLKN